MMPAGAPRFSEWAGLSVDVLLIDTGAPATSVVQISELTLWPWGRTVQRGVASLTMKCAMDLPAAALLTADQDTARAAPKSVPSGTIFRSRGLFPPSPGASQSGHRATLFGGGDLH